MPVPNDPELLLAAACCRWPPSPARDDAVRAAAAAVQDWERFQAVTLRQRVAGLVHFALGQAGVAPPASVSKVLANSALGIARTNMIAATETARLLGLIEAAGYPVVTLKGVALAALAYGGIALKHGKDIDLLVAPEHAQAVIALLEAHGYHLALPAEQLSPAQRAVLTRFGKDVTLARGRPYPQLELHWRLLNYRSLLPGITARSPTQSVALTSTLSVNTLAMPDLFTYLAVHGSGDGWFRLKWLADFNALMAGRPPAEISALYEHARSLRADWCAAQALLMANELFGLRLEPDFEAELRQSRRVRTLKCMAYQLMAGPDGRTELHDWWGGRMKLLFMQLLLARGVRHLADIVNWSMYVQIDMYRSSAPPWLYVFYPMFRLPLWIGRRLRIVDKT
jgi:Uncharacterised nucleotidyltransferase